MSELKTYQYYAGSKWCKPSSGQYFESEDPSIGKVWAKLPDCNLDDINNLLLSGADKVSINTAAVKDMSFINKASKKYGAQCIVVAVDAKKNIRL